MPQGVKMDSVEGDTQSDESETEKVGEAVASATGPDGEAVESGTEDIEAIKADLAKWKSMSRKNEDRAKANAAKAAKLDGIEEAQKTDAERSAERIESLQADLRVRDEQILRSKIATDKGLEPEFASALQGEDEAAMRAHADGMLAAIGRRYVAKSKLTPEQTGAGAQGQTLAQQVSAAESKGDYKLSLALKSQDVLNRAREQNNS